jgi:hypothetical protein
VVKAACPPLNVSTPNVVAPFLNTATPVFESPENDWNAAWKTGKQIMDMLALDDEI